jgi:3-phenylpropionate/trans-cinnamate dioxygenase ferredoxin subunit
MSTLIEVAKTDDLRDGSMKKVKFQKSDILLAKVGGKYYGVDNKCPHLGGDLSKGKLEGTIVICPNHHSKFDLTDGQVIQWTDLKGVKLNLARIIRPPKALRTYVIKEEGDKVFVNIE